MKIYLVYAILTLSHFVFAQEDGEAHQPQNEESSYSVPIEKRSCDFQIKCNINQKNINFEYKSLGDDCNEDSPGELILISNGKRFPLETKGNSLKKFEDVGNLPEICSVDGKPYPAIEISENRIALFTKIDGRPGYDNLGGLIIDIKKNKVIKQETNFGKIKNRYVAFIKTTKAIKTRLVKDYIKDVKCDCDAAFTDEWKEISVFTDTFKTKWIQ